MIEVEYTDTDIAIKVREFARDWYIWRMSDDYHEDSCNDWDTYALELIVELTYGSDIFSAINLLEDIKETKQQIKELKERLSNYERKNSDEYPQSRTEARENE